MTEKRFHDKVAVVTGGSRGIGAAVVSRLVSEGAAVVLGYRAATDAAEELTGRLRREGANIIAVRADVADPDQTAALIEQAVATFGRLHILASCAGIEHFDTLEKLTPHDFDHVFGINTRGQLFAAQHAAQHMTSGGRIILTSSISAHRAVFGHTLYAASKAAVEAMVLNLSAELGQHGITINAVSPGGTATDMAVENSAHYRHPDLDIPLEKWRWINSALGRLGEPDEVAAVYAFLASKDADYITGRTLQVDGGRF